MDLHLSLHSTVLILEAVLAGSLIGWMRSSLRGEPIGWNMIIKVMFCGAFAAFISGFVTIKYSFNIDQLSIDRPELVDHYKGLMVFFNTFGASAVEELAKYTVAVFILLTPQQKNQRLSDTILYMILIGLGFALVEDWLYLLDPQTVAPYRLLSFYLHSGTSAIIGYSLGRFRFGLTGYREVLRSIAAAILLHAIYNLTTELDDQQLALYLTIAVTVLVSLQIFILFRRTVEEEYILEQRHTPKPAEPTKLLNLERTVRGA